MSQTDTAPEVSQVETSQVSDEQTPVVEDQSSNEESEVTPESATQETEESQEGGEGQQQTEEERKPTRAERRLHQLLERGRQENPLADLLASMPEPQPDENGYYTPEQVRQMAAAEAARAIQLDRDVQSYRQQTEAFVSEIEEVGTQILEDFKDNPQLAETVNKILTSQLQAANLRTDERGRQFLVPVQKPSQLYAEIKQALEMTSKQGTEQATAALARQVAEGAITPTAARGGEQSSLQTLQKNLWSNPGKVAAELASRLPRSD